MTLPDSLELKWSWPTDLAINFPVLVFFILFAVPLWVLDFGIFVDYCLASGAKVKATVLPILFKGTSTLWGILIFFAKLFNCSIANSG